MPGRRLRNTTRRKRALNNSHQEIFIHIDAAANKDFHLSLSSVFPAVLFAISDQKRRLSRNRGLKFQLRLLVNLERFSHPLNKTVNVENWFPSDTYNVIDSKNIKKKIKKASADIFSRFDSFVEKGSGWVVKRVIKLSISLNRYRFFQGGCASVALPRALRNKRSCVSIKGIPRGLCFHYALAAGVGGKKVNKFRRCCYYDKIIDQLPFRKPEGPISIKEIQHLEKQCPISFNVYGFERIIFPLYVSTFLNKPFHVDLLYHAKHYYLITNMGGLLGICGKANRRKSFICQYCLCYFISYKNYLTHSQLCSKKGHQYSLPERSECDLRFTNFKNMITAPFVMYCDLETMISETEVIRKGKIFSKKSHVPISCGALTVCLVREDFGSEPFIYTGLDCIDKLFLFIQTEISRIERLLRYTYLPCSMGLKDKRDYLKAKHCFMCRKRFNDYEHITKVRDHCHLSGQFRFALCSTCNLTRAKTVTELYVFFHGLGNYDSHFLVQKLSSFGSDEIRVIPRNTERYLTFSIGDVHFKDSFQFLGESLATLVKNLNTKGPEYFKNVNKFIVNPNKRKMLKQKGVFPYNYFTDITVLSEKSLPLIEAFYNDLSGTPISKEDYKFAHQVWKQFHCKTFCDYLEIYLLADVLLLADVFENFRSNCLKDYSIDPVYYFSAPHFTFDAFLFKSQVVLQLFTDVNHYLFVMKGIRGGLSMVSKRYAKANNEYVGNFNPGKIRTFLIDFDANNLYGKAMKDFLPHSGFRWMTDQELSLEYILGLPPQGEIGCIVQCDMTYPPELFATHSDYPLAPVKKRVHYKELSAEARKTCDKHSLKRTTNVEKLLATFEKKEDYILHFRNLQLYVSLGLKVTKLKVGLVFRQSPVMSAYIDFNSKKRAEANNNFDVDFYKLLSNSLYGKTIENPEKRTRIKLCTDSKYYEKMVGKPGFKSAKMINPDLVSVEMKYPQIKINKPFYIGMTILELAKNHMYNFHYNVMKKHFGSRLQLLYTDTDSLLYEIESEDLYLELRSLQEHFDFSNYPENSALFSTQNKRVPGKFKDETASIPIVEFVGLRSKMYSFKVSNQNDISRSEIKVAKGVHKSVIANDLRFESYLDCLRKNTKTEHSFSTIRSVSHIVSTYNQQKVTLCPFDDKRFLLDDINSVPYGYYAVGSPT